MPSAKIVMYSSRKELLLSAHEYARSTKKYCNTQLSESWMREYQVPVLASGTHPHMTTSGSGGFLLTCTLVFDDGVEILKPSYKSMLGCISVSLKN